jgi:DNA-binding response OmpR family regulator
MPEPSAALSPFPAPPLPFPPGPSRDRPLAGLTLLLVEDSRFAAEGLRLVAQRSGARLRRAETLGQARRHLRVYRPDAVIVDLGLPDGRGEDLISDLARSGGPPVLGLSGDDTGLTRARRAGAAGFLAKPVDRMAAAVAAVLALFPDRVWLARTLADAALPQSDPLALDDDLRQAARWLGADGAVQAGHVAGFVQGLGRACGDPELEQAAAPHRIGDLARTLTDRLRQSRAAMAG